MEELNIEQKAKRYDEILARAKDANMPHNMKEFVDYLIPELKEGGDERIRKKLISYFSNIQGFSSLEYNYGITQEEAVAWLEKQGEQKPTWSEEDERNLEGIINEIEASKNNAPDYDLATYDRFLSLLKSLKDRVQPQPKQEWSEEEKARIDKIIDVLDWAEEKGHIRYSDWEDYVCYVKSLKPQNRWKPSKEQLDALREALAHIPDEYDVPSLTELFEQLKRL